MKLAHLERIAAFGDLFTDKIRAVPSFHDVKDKMDPEHTIIDLYLDRRTFQPIFVVYEPRIKAGEEPTLKVYTLHDNKLYPSISKGSMPYSNWTSDYKGITEYDIVDGRVNLTVIVDSYPNKRRLYFTINLNNQKLAKEV